MKQSYFNYNIKPNYGIENFYVGKSNFDAFDIIINNKLDNLINKQFFLLGPSKSGKTHISTIWQDKFNAIKYSNNLKKIIHNKKNVLVDDIFKNLNEENIFHIINHCKSNNLSILITSNKSLNNYNFKINDLSSRLKSFISIKIDLPDDELLINLIMKLLHDKQIIVKNTEIFNYIIKRADRSYEKIFMLIDKIDTLLLRTNKQLTIPLIKELI